MSLVDDRTAQRMARQSPDIAQKLDKHPRLRMTLKLLAMLGPMFMHGDDNAPDIWSVVSRMGKGSYNNMGIPGGGGNIPQPWDV